jgi:hypothetical protein
MPRSSPTRSSSTRSSPTRSLPSLTHSNTHANANAVAPMARTPSTTAQTLKDSLVSGVGSGIGFGIGSRLMSGLFGAPMLAVAETKSAVIGAPNLQQCYQNALELSEKPLCYALLSNEPRHHEFKQCMEASDNQIHMCKEFLPNE